MSEWASKSEGVPSGPGQDRLRCSLRAESAFEKEYSVVCKYRATFCDKIYYAVPLRKAEFEKYVRCCCML